MPSRMHGVVLTHRDAARVVGDHEELGQVYALGRFPNKTAFARALIAAGLAGQPESSVLHYLRDWLQTDIDGVRVPKSGQVYVTPIYAQEPMVPWPPQPKEKR